MEVVRWAEVTGLETGAVGRAGALGSMGRHGLHLPVDTNAYHGERLAVSSVA